MMLSTQGRGHSFRWVTALLLTCAVSSCALLSPTDDERGPYISDPRACSGSNLELHEATRHFQLAIPAQANDLRFASDTHPVSGEYSLTLEFTTTPAGLQAFLNASHLPQPEPDDDAQPIDQYAGCGLTDADFTRPTYADDERHSSDYVRRVALDRADPARPHVIIEATDT